VDKDDLASRGLEPVTPEEIYFNRRLFLQSLGFLGLQTLAPLAIAQQTLPQMAPGRVKVKRYEVHDSERPVTKEELATSYNNFYEFSLNKKDVKAIASRWKRPENWKIKVSGLVRRPAEIDLNSFLKSVVLEERIYRFRCVEAWSMVLPWTGFPLAKLVDYLEPLPTAKFVKFVTHVDRQQMPNINAMPSYPWPYTEGLTLAEARHDLSFLATGIYKKPLPNQNGAPIRLVVPWKYGFKSIKSIDSIEFVSEQPKSLWETLAPSEYGFYANVNPEVPHPRWSQARETRIDGSLFPNKIQTLKFNGYEKEVASLYEGIDLKRNF
jgi:sulfoxide reductase catalytic subunit YedY